MEPRWEEDESAEEFAEQFREFSCGFPEQVTEHVLLQRMVEGLPSELKLQAVVASSDFDVAVGQLSQLSEMMATRARKIYDGREIVNKITDLGVYWGGGSRNTGGTTDQEWFRDRRAPQGSPDNPVGFDPTNPEDVRPWNRSRQCYRCKHFGHI
jgi:hypothetical protein